MAFAASGNAVYVYLLEAGVFKSTDGARTWTPVSRGQIPSENYAGPLLAASGDTVVFADVFGTLYASFDGSSTWTKSQGPSSEINAVAASPTTIWVATPPPGCPTGPCGDTSGVYRSTDRGATWARQPADLGIPYSLLWANGALFAGTDNGVVRSDDGGVTFQPAGLTGQYVFSLLWTDALYARTPGGFYRSLDRGHSWSPIPTVPDREAQVVYGSGNTFFEVTGYGGPCPDPPCTRLYSTVNGGANWSPAPPATPSGLRLDAPNAFLSVGDRFLAGSIYAGVFATEDGGLNWEPSNSGPIGTLSPAVAEGDSVYGYLGRNFFASHDRGSTWAGFPTPGDSPASLLHHPDGSLLLGTQTDGIFRSTDQGATWAAFSSGIERPYPEICALYSGDGVVYAGTFGGSPRLYRKSGPADWVTVAVPASSTCAIAVVANALFVADNYSVFRSTDGGASWSAVLQPDSGAWKVYGVGGMLYVATGGGLLQTDDLGQTWRPTASAAAEVGAVEASSDHFLFGLGPGLGSSVFAKPLSGGNWQALLGGILSDYPLGLQATGDSLYAFFLGNGVQRLALSDIHVDRPISPVKPPNAVPVSGRLP